MATITRGQTFGETEQVTNTKLHVLVDSASIANIVNADLSAGADIAESKISFDGSTVVTLTDTQDVSGIKTFTDTQNFYKMVGSLASIGKLSATDFYVGTEAGINATITIGANIAIFKKGLLTSFT